MKLEPEDIKGFQRLWKEQFNTDLSEQEAQVKAICLLEMMETIYKPIPKPVESTTQLLLNFNQFKNET